MAAEAKRVEKSQREGLGTRHSLQGHTSLTYFLQLSPTSSFFAAQIHWGSSSHDLITFHKPIHKQVFSTLSLRETFWVPIILQRNGLPCWVTFRKWGVMGSDSRCRIICNHCYFKAWPWSAESGSTEGEEEGIFPGAQTEAQMFHI